MKQSETVTAYTPAYFQVAIMLSAIALMATLIPGAFAQTFTNETTTASPGLPGLSSSSVCWGDYDNDGDLDFLITGQTGTSNISQLWQNNNGTFANVTATAASGLPGVTQRNSVSWADYDNDGDLDFLITGLTSTGSISQLWQNNNGTFTNETATAAPGLPGLGFSSVSWGDYDNDGDLDLLMTGVAGPNRISQLWQNNNGTFTNETATAAPGLPGVSSGSISWADYDNDGDLDFLNMGSAGTGNISQLWQNNNGTFANVTATAAPGLPGLSSCSISWGDYDNDGDLDLLITGSSSTGNISQLWQNNNGTFTNETVTAAPGLPGVQGSSASWADYDNDGDLDFLLTGYTGAANIAQLWQNNNGTFTNETAAAASGLPGVLFSAVTWADYDHDGDLDFLISGQTGTVRISQLWRNNGTTANTPPSAPTGLASTHNTDNNATTLTWSTATDAETPAATLTYNVRIGTASGKQDILSAQADLTTGHRFINTPGNAGQGISYPIGKGLPLGTYYWSVQAVDQAFVGGTWAAEATFTIKAAPVLVVNTTLALNEGATAAITSAQLQTTDADHTASQLTYTVTMLPANGSLLVSSNALSVNGTFTQDDVNNNRVSYHHDGSETTTNAFTFNVTDADGAGKAAQTFSITINPVNDHPVLTVNTGLTLNEGATATITSAQLQATDADHTASLLTYTVTTLPTNGVLRVNNSALSVNGTFTKDDIDNNRVSYQHDGSETAANAFTFNVTDADGAGEAAQTFSITINPVNDAPSFTKGADIVVDEDGTSQTINNWAALITSGPAGEGTQGLSFLVSNDKNSLFDVQPALDASGTLIFTPAADAHGAATVTVMLKDDGGTAHGGTDQVTQTFTITITPVNDPPMFTEGSDITVPEDAPVYSSTWATDITAGADENAQSVTFTVTASNAGLFKTQPAIGPSGVLTFTPAPDASGSSTVSVSLRDNGGTVNFGIDQTPTETFAITVFPVNDAPHIDQVADQTISINDESLTVTLTGIHAGATLGEEDQSLTLDAVSDDPSLLSISSMTFTPGSTEATLVLQPLGNSGHATVTVALKDDGGVAGGGMDETTITFDVSIKEALQEIFIPNLFSPDGDGANDAFRVKARGVAVIELRVYNAFGKEVFGTTDPVTALETGWDGRHNGKEQPAGTYTWTLKGRYNDGKSLTGSYNRYGQVVLLR